MRIPQEDLNYAIIRMARRHRYLAGVLLGEIGLYPGQEGLLALLWEQDGRSQIELATALEVEPPTVHRSLVSLERAGFVRRVPSPQDGRVTLVELTDEGRAMQFRFAEAWQQLAAATVGDLSDRDRRTFHRLLLRVADNLGTARQPSDDHATHA